MEAEAEEPEEEAVPEVAVTEVGLSLKKKKLDPKSKDDPVLLNICCALFCSLCSRQKRRKRRKKRRLRRRKTTSEGVERVYIFSFCHFTFVLYIYI